MVDRWWDLEYPQSAWLGVTREVTSLACETSPVRATAHLGSNRPRWTSRCPCLSPVRIESAFIADHVEVDPTTRTLDVRTGFQSYVKVPNLPFRHVLGLAIVVQVAFDEYDHPFSLAIDVERVDDLPVMHHEDFTFEIPHGIGAMDGISHHYPFAFSLPVEFYEVGVHRVIVGNDDSDYAVIPFVVQMVTLEHD